MEHPAGQTGFEMRVNLEDVDGARGQQRHRGQ
jgi:hypothetical protein